jgi:hypothetical protein
LQIGACEHLKCIKITVFFNFLLIFLEKHFGIEGQMLGYDTLDGNVKYIPKAFSKPYIILYTD